MEPLKELLLHPEINLNQRYGGETPLNAAISNGRSEAAALLLHYGADPNIPGERDTFPLTSSIKTLRSHPITSRLLRMTTPSTDFSFDLSSMSPSLLEEVLASRLDFSRHSSPWQSNSEAIFQDYQRDPKAARKSLRLKLGIEGIFHCGCFVSSVLIAFFFFCVFVLTASTRVSRSILHRGVLL